TRGARGSLISTHRSNSRIRCSRTSRPGLPTTIGVRTIGPTRLIVESSTPIEGLRLSTDRRLATDRRALETPVMSKLSKNMTLRQFEHGYWYATEIKTFAQSLGVPGAGKLRKDELEKAIRHFLAHGTVAIPTKRSLSRSGVKDVELGLRLDRRVVLYTNDRET